MATLTNQRGDRVTIDCGGFGGDNVFGTVEENAGQGNFVLVQGARVRLINLSNGEQTNPAVFTNAQGKFDVDLDAARCHKIWAHVEWRDGNGAWHIVVGTFKCPPCDQGAGPKTIEERAALLGRLESSVLELTAVQLEQRAAIAVLHQEAESLLQTQLNAFIALKTDEERKRAIDQEIRQELGALQVKFDFARAQGPFPTPEQQWRILEELWKLLQKLVWKAFVIQGMVPPEFPPQPPRPPGGGGGGGIT
jgi:hypothetical protein